MLPRTQGQDRPLWKETQAAWEVGVGMGSGGGRWEVGVGVGGGGSDEVGYRKTQQARAIGPSPPPTRHDHPLWRAYSEGPHPLLCCPRRYRPTLGPGLLLTSGHYNAHPSLSVERKQSQGELLSSETVVQGAQPRGLGANATLLTPRRFTQDSFNSEWSPEQCGDNSIFHRVKRKHTDPPGTEGHSASEKYQSYPVRSTSWKPSSLLSPEKALALSAVLTPFPRGGS